LRPIHCKEGASCVSHDQYSEGRRPQGSPPSPTSTPASTMTTISSLWRRSRSAVCSEPRKTGKTRILISSHNETTLPCQRNPSAYHSRGGSGCGEGWGPLRSPFPPSSHQFLPITIHKSCIELNSLFLFLATTCLLFFPLSQRLKLQLFRFLYALPQRLRNAGTHTDIIAGFPQTSQVT
jgi:hypothetical protein